MNAQRQTLNYPGFSGHRQWTLRTVTPPAPFAQARSRFYLRGRAALWNGLKLLAHKPGSRVLFPSYHCSVELAVLRYMGYAIDYYPIRQDLRIDFDDLARRVRPDTRMLYVIHYYGFAHPLAKLRQFCAAHRLTLIEDCAEALYCRDGDQPVGAAGIFSIFSLYKFLPLPCCGALVLNDPQLPMPAQPTPPPWRVTRYNTLSVLARDLKVRGITRSVQAARKNWQDSAAISMSAFASDFQPERDNHDAPWLSRWLFRHAVTARVVERRRHNFRVLFDALRHCRRVTSLTPALTPGACPAYFPVIVNGDPAQFITFCRERGVQVEPFWRRVPDDLSGEEFPEAHQLKAQVVVLPVHQELRPDDLQRVVEVVTSHDSDTGAPTLDSAVLATPR